jgi:putative Holliday junction resolvase
MEPRPPILALDYGRVRLGLAVSDALGLAAHPLPALTRRKGDADLAELRRLVAEREVARLVVGLPLNMDGSEGPMAAEARRFGDALGAALGLPVTYEDERLSTDEAEARLSAVGLRPSDRKRRRDSLAAAVILEAVLAREGLPAHGDDDAPSGPQAPGESDGDGLSPARP